MKKVEFASPEWLTILQGLLQKYTDLSDERVNLSICEVFTSVPPHLDKRGDGIVVWHCRIDGDHFHFEETEIDDADIKSISDYDFVLQLARMKIGPDTQEIYQSIRDEGAAVGKLETVANHGNVPKIFQMMHNDLAEMTA